ncbi:MAG: hypothetical protein KC589_08965 [Nanoarchaeota archaeon]|nr:hypothetical protein [Nanoarchaeota archaeon]
MITPLYFGIGFLIYVTFTVTTFKVYSQKQEVTKILVLWMIYFYYSILAAYVINLVTIGEPFFEKIVQIAVYWIVCGVYVSYYYDSEIKEEEKEFNADL